MAQIEDYHLNTVATLGHLTLSEQAYITLKQAILTGNLLPGAKLNEVELAKQLNVSATPVREAFRKLEKDNLVVRILYRGVFVKGYTPEEIISMYQCRAVMEGLAARLCATEASEEQKQELVALAKECTETTNPEDRVQVNSRLHSTISLFSGNERVTDYLAEFREMVNRDMYLSTTNQVRTDLCNEEHERIIQAIVLGDADLAEKHMRDHIQNAFVFKKAHADLKNKQNA